jgi:hypothetical protein
MNTMNARHARFAVLSAVLTMTGCQDRSEPSRSLAPSFDAGGAGRPAVLVNPNATGNGTAKTIQEGIAMVAEGGDVMVLPGTYPEGVVIDKGLTLEAVGGESGPVVIEPPGAPTTAVAIATPAPVAIRGLIVHATGANGIRGVGVVDVTVERVTVTAVNPPLGVDRLISIVNDPNPTGGRGRLTVRESFMDGAIACAAVPTACTFDPTANFPQVFGVLVAGDVDALVERNVIRRTGGACIFVAVRNDLSGVTNADILDNDLDECHPLGRAGAIFVAPVGGVNPSATLPVTVTGTVNTVGNTIANSSRSCLTSTAISYIVLGGRIEHNRIAGVVQSCAFATQRARPAAIWLGSQVQSAFYPAVGARVRFNNITGNAQAGLRVGSNMTTPIDASCNFWGAADGPSGAGPGSGDAVVLESGAATPTFTPFATGPIAATGATGC